MTMMKYRLNRRAALGLLGGSAAAALVPVPGARVSAQSLEKLSFQTNWRAQAEHGGFYLALANGIYKKYGIDAEIRPGGPQQNPSQLLLGGRVDMTMSTSFCTAILLMWSTSWARPSSVIRPMDRGRRQTDISQGPSAQSSPPRRLPQSSTRHMSVMSARF